MLYIHGIGHFHPENVIDNRFLEDLDIGTNEDWILDRVGIRSRRTVLDLEYIRQTRNQRPEAAVEATQYSNAETGRRAALSAIENAGISVNDVGMVIAGGCSPDNATPAEACTIAEALEISAPAFDLNSACSTFGAQLYFLSMMQPAALPDYVLIVQPENNTRIVNYADRRNAVLWGDCTTAAVVSTKHRSRAAVQLNTLESDPSGWRKVFIPRVGHFDQDGRAVQGFAIRKTASCLSTIQDRYGESGKNLYFIGHQANLRMLEFVCKRCRISDDQHYFNVDSYGNTGAAGGPAVLSQNWHRFEESDVVAFVVVGAGLSWSSLSLQFDGLQNGLN